MPIAIWVGDRDSFFPLDAVNSTKRLFESNGFRVRLTILPNQGHSYDDSFEEVNRGAWKFFKQAQCIMKERPAPQD
jgi:dienelactone hydrolase